MRIKIRTPHDDKDHPVPYKTYKGKPGTDLSQYKNTILKDTIFNLISLKEDEGYVEPVWNDSHNGQNFVATADNTIFTATATKTYQISFDPNGGSGTMSPVTVKKGVTYHIPTPEFSPLENKEFAGWKVQGPDGIIKSAGDDIDITDNLTLIATWKDKPAPEPAPGGETPALTPNPTSPSTEVTTASENEQKQLPTPGEKLLISIGAVISLAAVGATLILNAQKRK